MPLNIEISEGKAVTMFFSAIVAVKIYSLYWRQNNRVE